jgi:plasmid stabilization system protein ParE
MTRIIWRPAARQDRAAIMDYLAADNPVAALELDELIEEKTQALINLCGLEEGALPPHTPPAGEFFPGTPICFTHCGGRGESFPPAGIGAAPQSLVVSR